MDVKLGHNYVIEYKLPSESVMELAGFHEEFTLQEKQDYTVKSYLPDNTTTDAFACKITKKKGEENTLSTKAMPVDLKPIKDFYIPSNDFAKKYGIGIIDKQAGLYTYTDTAVIKSITLEIPENDACSLTIEFNCEDFVKDEDTVDYVDGTNITAHAILPTSEPLSTVDLTDVYWGSFQLKPTKLTLKIDYDITSKWDSEAQLTRYFISGRKITVDFALAELPAGFKTAVKNGEKNDFTFTLGGQTITVKEVKFPELKLSVRPEEIIMTDFSSLEATEIVFGF